MTPWNAALQAPLSMGFSRQEYWRGLPFPPPGNLPNPGIKPKSSAWQLDSSLLKEITPELSLEGLMLKLKLQYFGHLMGRTYSLEKILMLGRVKAGGEGDDRG